MAKDQINSNTEADEPPKFNEQIDAAGEATANAEKGGKMRMWFKRMGWGAFAFFFIKGLVWLAVFFGLTKFLGC